MDHRLSRDDGAWRGRRRWGLTALLLPGILSGCQDLGNTADAGSSDVASHDGSNPPGPGCGLIAEPEPNDTVGRAAAYTIGTSVVGCLATADDVDVYEVKAPSDPAGGYFQAGLTDVGAGTVSVEVASARDNAPFVRGTFTNSPGASLFFYWATAPGAIYRISVARFSAASGPFRFTLRATYNAIADAFEPNDTRAEAKPIDLGRVHSGYFFAGHVGETVDAAAFSDWYSATLAAGPVTVRVADVPTTVRPEIELFDANNSSVRGLSMYNNDPGGSIQVSGAVAAGPHRLVVRIFALAPDTAGKGAALPENFLKPYQLSVSQP